MVVIIGFIVIIGGSLAGFYMAGGSLGLLIHAAEIVTIAGMLFGCAIVMAPAAILKEIVTGTLNTLKGSPYAKADYEDLFKMMYELFQLGRRNGMIALEEHVMNPEASSLFKKYDKFWKGEYEQLKIWCDDAGIEFLSTPFDVASAEFLNDLMAVFKVSSSDITNKPFIEYICEFSKPMILSTGASDLNEIDRAVSWIDNKGVSAALLHCILSYPTPNCNKLLIVPYFFFNNKYAIIKM